MRVRRSPLLLAALLCLNATSIIAQEPLPPPNAPNGAYQEGPPVDTTPNPYSMLQEITQGFDDPLPTPRPPANVVAQLRAARAQALAALDAYVEIDGNLPAVQRRIHAAQVHLNNARRFADGPLGDSILRHQARLTAAARMISDLVLQRAIDAGVDRERTGRALREMALGDRAAEQGDHTGAVKHYFGPLSLQGALKFDPEVFKDYIRSRLDTEAVGYAVALNRNGLLVDSWANGEFRTVNDPAQTPATVNTEINVASVSKMITATTVMRVMQERKINMFANIGPYLPWDWERGDQVNFINFKLLMTHRSGLADNAAPGTSYTGLKTAIATDITLQAEYDKYPYRYQNANFALFRVILRNMNGGCNSAEDNCIPTDDEAASLDAYYRNFVQCQIFKRMGISTLAETSTGCGGPDLKPNPNEGQPTLYYWFGQPPNSTSVSTGDWTAIGGGGGWNMSVMELARFLAHLRYNDKILTPTTRSTMFKNFFGFHPPDSNAWVVGAFGPYRIHGGDLCWPLPGATGPRTCAMNPEPGLRTAVADFPDGTQAAIVMNSRGGSHDYQGILLRKAYDAAWVKN